MTEYSEMGAELAERRADDGRLLFCAGSIANHMYSLSFLERYGHFTACGKHFDLVAELFVYNSRVYLGTLKKSVLAD